MHSLTSHFQAAKLPGKRCFFGAEGSCGELLDWKVLHKWLSCCVMGLDVF